MIFLEDLKITGKKVFIFGALSEYSNHIIKLLSENEIRIDIWDSDANIIIKNRDKLEYKSKYITFIDPQNINIQDYEYFILSNCINKNEKYYNFFNKRDIKIKLYTDFDIIYKMYPNIEFTGIIGNYGKNVISGVLEHVKTESRLDIDNRISQEEFDEPNKIKINIPIIIPFNMIKYIKCVKFSSIIVYDYDKTQFQDKENIKIFSTYALNNSEVEIIVNINDIDLKNWYEELKNNQEYIGTLIPISVSKILNNGISFVNNTICDYYENNLNYDIMENEYIDNNFTKLAILITYIYNKKNNILDEKDLIQCLSTYKGEQNFLEHIKNIENIQVINNTSVDSDELLELPFKTYDNIYTLLLLNSKEYNKKFFESKSRIVFYVDKYNFIKNKNENVFDNEKTAFERIYSLCLLENKENDTVILISTSSINNEIRFDEEIENIKNTLNNM